MKTINVHHVQSCLNSDSMSWPFRYEHIWYFRKKADAIIAAEWEWTFWEWWDIEKHSIVIYDSIDEYRQQVDNTIREGALSKLSEEEKTILWLK